MSPCLVTVVGNALLLADMYGISDHDLMFSHESQPVEDDELVGTGVVDIEQKVIRTIH